MKQSTPNWNARVTSLLVFVLLTVLLCSCDPIGWRRIRLQLHSPTSDNKSITLDSTNLQEALTILDGVAVQHKFYPAKPEPGYVRVYTSTPTPITNDHGIYIRSHLCEASLTTNGLLVSFDRPGFLAANPEAESLFKDVRSAFIQKYGKQNVKSYVFKHTTP